MWLYLLFGPGVMAWTADIPSCFRLLPLMAILLPLFVYEINTDTFGVEWFVDLVCPFGWTPAEWQWQCMLAMILWAFRLADLWQMFAYVDNFFYLFHPKDPGIRKRWRSTRQLFAAIEGVFSKLGIPLHEQMVGTEFKGLGWMWDLSPTEGPPAMVCANDKFAHLCRQLERWSSAAALPFEEVESVIGFLSWIVCGLSFTLGLPHLAYLRLNLGRHRGMNKHVSCAEAKQMVLLTPEAKEALSFWNDFFPVWDRRCLCFLDFGPMAGPEVLWRMDASTRWGMGGFMWRIGDKEAYFILREWTSKEKSGSIVHVRESTGVLEAQCAAECALRFARRSAGCRVLLETDHSAVALAIRRVYSKTRPIMKQVKRLGGAVAQHRICLRAAHIVGNTAPPPPSCAYVTFHVAHWGKGEC
jgi:hypothetical protein